MVENGDKNILSSLYGDDYLSEKSTPEKNLKILEKNSLFLFIDNF